MREGLYPSVAGDEGGLYSAVAGDEGGAISHSGRE